MTEETAVRLAAVLVLLGGVVVGVSLAPTTAQFSDQATIDNNSLEAGGWDVDLVVDDGGTVELEATVELTATVAADARHSQPVTVTLEIDDRTLEEELVLEGNESARTTFTVDADDLGAGEHEYTVTVGDEAANGTVTVVDGEDTGVANDSSAADGPDGDESNDTAASDGSDEPDDSDEGSEPDDSDAETDDTDGETGEHDDGLEESDDDESTVTTNEE